MSLFIVYIGMVVSVEQDVKRDPAHVCVNAGVVLHDTCIAPQSTTFHYVV